MVRFSLFLLTALTLNASAMTAVEDKNKTLFDAIEQGNLDAVKKALESGASIEARERSYNQTPLIKAAEKGNLEIVKYLISKKANINAQSVDKMNALHWATGRDANPELIEFLIKSGIPANSTDADGSTPLHGVINVSVARVLLEHGADINQKDNNGKTALMSVLLFIPISTHDHKRIIELTKFFLEQGANPNIKDNNGILASNLAEAIKEPDIKTQVIGLLNKFIQYKEPLFKAVWQSNIDAVKKSASQIPINIKDEKGNTPLHYAVRNADEKMVQFLLSIKADPSIKNRGGKFRLIGLHQTQIFYAYLFRLDMHQKYKKNK